jgi:hypothetical protein
VPRHRGDERRGPSRPKPGDLAPCAKCTGVMRFEEHVTITRQGVTVEKAAWICRNPACLYERFVRNEDRYES